MISASVGKSGPLMCFVSCAMLASGLSSSSRHAATTSRTLCDGMSVAIPTAMPDAPLSSTCGKPRRQQLRLAQRAVEVLAPVGRALLQLRQQRLRELRQPRLGVAHRRERFRIVGRAPVPLPFDERIAHRERLRHQHHGLVAGAVAVRMKLADDVADRARRLLELRVRPRGRAPTSRRRCGAAPA